MVARMVANGMGSPFTSSAGRLFDAVAAICGVRARVAHEGQAAAELEGLASRTETGAYPMGLADSASDGLAVVDPRDTVRAVCADVDARVDIATIAARFHNALADATARACAVEAQRRGLARVVLSGGVFQNRLLVEGCARRLRAEGLEVLFPAVLPPNDAGIAYGQVAVAVAREALR
jgi:hydrogenase maturation protein HypF